MAVPTQLDNPIALVNHTPDGDQLQEQEQESSSEDESTDPQYYAQPQPQVVMAPGPVGYVTIRIPLENKVFCDIDFPTDIPCEDFFDYVFANMALDSATAELGWKANDEPERGPVHRLATNDPADLDHAFQTLLLKKKRSSQREVFMEIIHLNPTPVESRKKNHNRTTDLVYSAELRHVQKKLLCGLHMGPNRWCYVTPEKPDDHFALGYEEISLWARSIHENEADPNCLQPPYCLRLPGVQQTEGCIRTNTASKSLVPSIHVHVNNHPSPAEATINRTAVPGPSTENSRKRSRATHMAEESSGSDSEENSGSDGDESSDSDGEEAMLLSDVIDRLHRKFPQLDFLQYMPIFEQEGIIYAETVSKFSKDFYMDLGFTEGAVRQFLSGVKRSLELEKREKKRVRRQISVELL